MNVNHNGFNKKEKSNLICKRRWNNSSIFFSSLHIERLLFWSNGFVNRYIRSANVEKETNQIFWTYSVILIYIKRSERRRTRRRRRKRERGRKEWGYNRLYQAKQSSVTHVCTTFINGKRNTSVLPLSSIIETCSKAETHPVIVTYQQ